MIFGITGDLARKMTFRALYRLEKRGKLDCPIIGVGRRSDWGHETMRQRAHESIVDTLGEVDEEVFARLAARMRFVAGNFDEQSTYETLAEELEPSTSGRSSTSRSRRSSSRRSSTTSHAAGLTAKGRFVIEKPFGHDLASARALQADLTENLQRGPDPQDRPLPRQGAGDGHHLPALRQLDPRAGLEPGQRRLRPDDDGRELRCRGPRPLLRRRRRDP